MKLASPVSPLCACMKIFSSLKISLKFVPKVRINNIPALIQIMAWRRRGDKPISEPMVVSLLAYLYALLGPSEFKKIINETYTQFSTINLAMLQEISRIDSYIERYELHNTCNMTYSAGIHWQRESFIETYVIKSTLIVKYNFRADSRLANNQ